MGVLWELFGFRSWRETELDEVDTRTYEWMLSRAREVAAKRAAAGGRRG